MSKTVYMKPYDELLEELKIIKCKKHNKVAENFTKTERDGKEGFTAEYCCQEFSDEIVKLHEEKSIAMLKNKIGDVFSNFTKNFGKK